jgi:hypothetical protein
MLAYRSRPVFVPAARPNDPIAPYRTQVMRRSRLFGWWGVAVALGVLCGLIAQSGCSLYARIARPTGTHPTVRAGFHASSTIPAAKSNSDRKLIEATMCPISVVALQAGELFCSN